MNTNFDASAVIRLEQAKALALYQKSLQVARNQGTVKTAPVPNTNTDASAETASTAGGIYCCGPVARPS